MEYNIRPLSFAETFDRSFRVLADNAVVLIGIAVIIGIPENAFAPRPAPGPGSWYQIVLLLFALAAGPLVQAALTWAIADSYLGKPVTIASAYKSAWSIILPIIGTYLLFYGTFALVSGSVALIALAFRGLGFIGFLGIIAAIPLFIYLMVRWSLLGPIMIVERRFGLATLRRSGELVQGVWWRTLGIVLIAAVIVRVPLSVLNFFWSSIPIVGVLLSGLVTSIGIAYSAVVLTVYYFDRRCRIEDFDLRLLAEQIRAEGAQGSPAMTGAPAVD
jgi:hypothetical protein